MKGERGKIKTFYLDKTRHGEQSDTAMSPWMWKNAEVSIYTRGTYLMELLLPNTFSFMHDDNRKHKLHSP